MSKNWKPTLWEIIYMILTIGLGHIQKRKQRLKEREEEKKQAEEEGREEKEETEPSES
ncbi:hypothetical protein LJB85_01305 [Porphyromonadaceae bacterium OttesenSCG-928-L07]|nr:hypothetical protein [Porphyromonadaceae bacterium OttesenSCG-928-L07]